MLRGAEGEDNHNGLQGEVASDSSEVTGGVKTEAELRSLGGYTARVAGDSSGTESALLDDDERRWFIDAHFGNMDPMGG